MATPSPEELAAARIAATGDFLAYSMTMRPWFDWSLHHLVTVDALSRIASGECKRLLLFQPPRTSKSTLVSLSLPGYFLGSNPDSNVMVASYGADLAYDMSKGVRSDVRSEDFPFPIDLRKGESTVKQWGIAGHRGSMIAAGVGGSLTGKGAHLLVVDDPVKDRKQADSPTYREAAWDWFREVAYTRLAPGGRIVILMTRWHEGDLAGMVLDQMERGEGEHWDIVSIPAIAYGLEGRPPWLPFGDPLGRLPGEHLWPERFTMDDWARIEGAVGPRGWSALYQQVPSAAQGLVFKASWMKNEYDPGNISALKLRRVIVVVDSAFKEGVSNSASAITTWGKSDTNLYVLDDWAEQVDYEDLLEAAISQWNRALNMTGVTPTLVIENKASGQSLIQTIRKTTAIPVETFPDPDDLAQKRLASTSKEARADSATPAFKADRVWLPRSASWKAAWIKEHVVFPTAIRNDRVDTSSIAVAVLYGVESAASASVDSPTRTPGLEGVERFRESVYNAARGSSRLNDLGGYNANRGRR